MHRKVAFCVGNWASESTLYSWTYAKRYFLRKVGDEQGNEVLSDLDKLFVVHVSNGKVKDRWDAGGPILPRLSTALANYPHQVVELEARDTAAAILDFAAREDIDVLILGSREHKGAMTKMVAGVSTLGTTLGSTSETVKARCKCPCLIIRPSSARNEKMRIRSMRNLASLMEGGLATSQASRGSILSAATEPEPRKVCIAFERAEPGSNMTAWAAKHCLFPDDDIHLVHMTNRSPLEKMQKSASFQKAMLKPRASVESLVQEEDCDTVGAEELAGYNEPCRARLKGDAKSELCDYLELHRIDLLIVGFSAAGRLRKALAGGSLSTYMLHHAACPLVVLPLKSMAWEEQDTLPDLPTVSWGHDASALPEADGTSPPPLNSLGPRVSMSRSLSHQPASIRDQLRRSVDASPGPPAASDAAPDAERSRSDSTAVLPPRSGGHSVSSRGRYPGLVSPRTQDSREGPLLPLSPFQAISRDSAESMDSQGHAVRQSFGSGAQAQQVPSELASLRQQLEAREVQVASLQEEVKHLKLQLAALQGSASPGRVMLPAS